MSGHGFTRDRVKEYISRLTDEDADKIVFFADRSYEAGMAVMPLNIPFKNSVCNLAIRLGLLHGEIDVILKEADEAGRRDGGHPAYDGRPVAELRSMLSAWSVEAVLRQLSDLLVERSERARTKDTDYARRLGEAATVVTRAMEVIQTKNVDD